MTAIKQETIASILRKPNFVSSKSNKTSNVVIIPVTIPKRAAILCSNMATKLESKITLSNVYLYSAPPAIDVIQFPGSI